MGRYFNTLRIGIGISIDGSKAVHDQFRLDHKGNGTFDRVSSKFKKYKNKIDDGIGILSVINIEACPVETVDAFFDLGGTRVDFLLPEANHVKAPFTPENVNYTYGSWLVAAFKAWNENPKKAK